MGAGGVERGKTITVLMLEDAKIILLICSYCYWGVVQWTEIIEQHLLKDTSREGTEEHEWLRHKGHSERGILFDVMKKPCH